MIYKLTKTTPHPNGCDFWPILQRSGIAVDFFKKLIIISYLLVDFWYIYKIVCKAIVALYFALVAQLDRVVDFESKRAVV